MPKWKRKTFDVTKMSISKRSDIIGKMRKWEFDKFSVGYEGKKKYYIFWKQVPERRKLKKVMG